MQITCPTHPTPGTMGSGNRNKVFFLPFLDQIFLQLLYGFHEMLVFRNFIKIPVEYRPALLGG
jgi:hypothetical protein